MLILWNVAQGQSGSNTSNHIPDSLIVRCNMVCGTNSDFIRSLKGNDSSNTPNSSQNVNTTWHLTDFPVGTYFQCGKFTVYYADLIPGSPVGGFNDPTIVSGTLTLGAQRRNTLCQVLWDIQNMIDFSLVPNGAITLCVDNSYIIGTNAAPNTVDWYAEGGPVWIGNLLPVYGVVNNYIKSGTDPFSIYTTPYDFHSFLKVNFDTYYNQGTNFGDSINYNNGTGPVDNCQFDLYSVIYHEICHVLGWFSLLDMTPVSPVNVIGEAQPSMIGGMYSAIDNSIHLGNLEYPTTILDKLIVGGAINTNTTYINPITGLPIGTTTQNNYWLNGQLFPNNDPVYSGYDGNSSYFYKDPGLFLGHLDYQMNSYALRHHISPGERQDYVMAPFLSKGVERRFLTKGELRAFINILGYNLTSTFQSLNNNLINNNIPVCTKMATQVISSAFKSYLGAYDGADFMTPDYTIVNNNVPFKIPLTFGPTTIYDLDNDPVTIMPGTIVNFRGCGDGNGNNANQLQIGNGGTSIIYNPRHNFYGRAQFGFNLWDGKEKGPFVIYTVDVQKGTNVSLPANGNMVLNPGFEEGTEVRRLGVEETKINGPFREGYLKEGRFSGAIFSDSHPRDFYTNSYEPAGGGIFVKDSWALCDWAQILNEEFGFIGTNFTSIPNFPSPNGQKRFQKIFDNRCGYFLLTNDLQTCKKYKLEFDFYGSAIDNSSFEVGFLNENQIPVGDYLACSNPVSNFIVPTVVGTTTNTTPVSSWQKYTLTFEYCASQQSSVMYLKAKGTGSFLIDNISLSEYTPNLGVSVTATQPIPCGSYQLTPNVTNLPNSICNSNQLLNYSWSPNSGLSCYTCANPIASPTSPTTYSLQINSGCQTASSSISLNQVTVTANALQCNNCNVSALMTLIGAPSTSTSLITNATIVFNGTFTVDKNLLIGNCPNLLFDANAVIKVNPGFTLNIKTSTLKSLCNQMWTGIQTMALNSSIIIDNSTLMDMIEGVHTAQGSTLTITTTSFINNYLGIWIENNQTNSTIIRENIFTSTSLLTPYTGQKGKYGIMLNNCSYIDIGSNSAGPNNFSNLKTGIYVGFTLPSTTLCQNNIHNCNFTNISGGSWGLPAPIGGSPISFYNDLEGTAIFGENKKNANLKLTVDYPSLSNTANFNTCTKGITTNSMSTKVINTKFSNVIWGINCSTKPMYDYQVYNNTLTDARYGINFLGNTNSALVSGNAISSVSTNGNMNSQPLLGATGIMVDNFTVNQTANSSFRILNNGITINHSAGVGIGISNRGVVLNNNTVAFTNTAINSYALHGFDIRTAQGCYLYCNTVNTTYSYNGPGSNFLTQQRDLSGYFLSDSKDITLQCNASNGIRYGYNILGNCATGADRVKSNSCNNHLNGWLLRQLVNPGTLGNSIGDASNENSNAFFGIYAPLNGNFVKVYVLADPNLSPAQKIIYSGNGTLLPNESISNVSGAQYQVYPLNSNHATYQCPSSCPIIAQSDNGNASAAFITNLDLAEQIARDSVLYSEYQEGGAWIAAQRLYYELYNDSAARDNSQILDSFFLATQSSVIGDLHDADEQIQQANESFLNDVTAYENWLAAAKYANNKIDSSYQQALNERQINGIYLRWEQYGVDSLSVSDSSAIANLALQCPWLGGQAVYKARTLYDLYVNMNYDDLDICNNAGVYKGTGVNSLFNEQNNILSLMYLPTSAEKNICVYPNPHFGKFMIKYLLDEEDKGIFQVVDVYGKMVIEATLNPFLGMQTIDMNSSPAGVYFYRYIVNSILRGSGKMVLVH